MVRELNACGFSSETIAAEYETDAALAAFAAEDEQRTLDGAAAEEPS